MTEPTITLGAGRLPPGRFTPLERRVVGGLTALFALRMMGMYLVLPVFAPYAASLPGSTPLLVGMSVGAYGLTQTLLQVPFGAWSDRWGRRPVLTLGLSLFGLGSIVCALADTTWWLVTGRLIQGMGAIASVAVAMIADLTRDSVRTRAMAMLGVAIGGSFAAGLLFGPWAAAAFGVPSLFWLTAALTFLGIAYLWWRIPDPPVLTHHEETEYTREHLFEVVTNPNLLRLDWGTFNLHAALTSIFVTAPFLLEGFVAVTDYWKIFLPIMAVGLFVLLAGARLGEKAGRGKRVALVGQGLLVASMAVMALGAPGSVYQPAAGLTVLVAGLGLFVIGFALLEPLLPALLTRFTQQTNRGTAAGIFNMSQFSGAFVGGLIAGAFLESDVEALFWILAGMSLLWFLGALRMEDPRHLDVMYVALPGAAAEHKRRVVRALLHIRGVEDVAWERDRERLAVRYAPETVDPAALRAAGADAASSPDS